MSQEAARPSVVKSTYKNLSEILTAYWSGERKGSNSLVNTIHGSPRLTQWVKVADGYRIWSMDEVLSVTVTPDKIYTAKGNRTEEVQDGLPAQALYSAIQTAQQIVQEYRSDEPDEAYFEEGENYSAGAALDVALGTTSQGHEVMLVLAETHSEPLVEEDAELIEDVCQETISPTPDAINVPDDEKLYDPERISSSFFIANANQKNATTDGVICRYCGNLNQSVYKGACPKCPKGVFDPPETVNKPAVVTSKTANKPGRDEVSEGWLMARLKSLQGRILTVLDASPIADKTQREAVKSLVNKEFRREMNKVSDGGWRATDPRYEE